MKDIMVKKDRSQTQALTAEPFMKAFYQSSASAMIIGRDDMSIIDVNESFLRIFGYTRKEVIGSTAASLNLYHNPAERSAILKTLSERGTIRNYEFTGRTKTGKVVNLLLSADDVSVKGRHYIIASGMDITDRKKAEEKLKNSEAMLARAEAIAHVGCWEREIPSQKVSWSDETYRIFGFKPQECEITESLFLEHIHPDDRARIENSIGEAIENDRPLDNEFRIVRHDGEIRWARGKAEVMRSEDGVPSGLFGTILDVTERKQAEEQQRESEQKYRILVEQADDGIILVQDAVMKYVNPHMAKLLGATVEEMTGSFIADYIDDADADKVIEMHRRRLAGEELPSIYETTLKRRDGRPVQSELNVGVVTYRGRPATQVIVRDITERKRIEEALRSSQEAAVAILNASQEPIFLIDASGRDTGSKFGYGPGTGHGVRKYNWPVHIRPPAARRGRSQANGW
jgi:PAS domain S-box-containing protein